LEARAIQADLMNSVGMLAAGIAHEINNPMTYVSLHVGQAERRLAEVVGTLGASFEHTALGEAVSSALRSIRDAREGTDRVVGLVRNFRSFSRADSAETSAVDVRNVLDAAIKIA